MSSRSSNIDPAEFDEMNPPFEQQVEQERRRGRLIRRRAAREENLHSTNRSARREAQEIYSTRRRRTASGRQRTSGQQTESARNPVRLLAEGSEVTILLRMENTAGIRMRIDSPHTSRPHTSRTVSAYVSAESVGGSGRPRAPPEGSAPAANGRQTDA